MTGVYAVLNSIGNSYNALAQDGHGDLATVGSFSVTAENGRVSRIDPYTGVPLETFNAVTPGALAIFAGWAFSSDESSLRCRESQ